LRCLLSPIDPNGRSPNLSAGLAPQNEELENVIDRNVDQRIGIRFLSQRFMHRVRNVVAPADRNDSQQVYLTIARAHGADRDLAIRWNGNIRCSDAAGITRAACCEDNEEECKDQNQDMAHNWCYSFILFHNLFRELIAKYPA